MNPVRILNVLSNLKKGGTEQYIMNYYRKIDRSKVQFDFLVLSTENGIYEDEIEKLGGKVFKIPPFTQRPLENILKRDKFFKENTYSIVEIHAPSQLRYSYAKIAKKYGAKIVIYHAHSTSNKPKSILHKFAEKKVKKFCDYRFACSIQAGYYVFGSLDFSVIPNAIEVEKFAFNQETRKRLRKELNISDKYVIGHIGRFTEEKNHKFLIKVFERLCELDDNCVLMLIGTGKLKENIQANIKNTKLQNKVIFMGLRNDVHELLNSMDVFVLPSLYEGLGIVGVEAQCSGLPCVFADTITTEIKFSENVFYLSLKDNIDIWSDTILKMKNIKRNTNLSSIIENGYDINHQSKILQDFYCKIYKG